ncbi:DUF4386 domain-containing protein [Ilumatobacter nonamiensis]|uniref:DUF4386 domain-containing protein n=1 Tax=Ilumatobacter nonamiensis TaxID=467093 RepID=UPI000685DF8B|nr:DUF4386 domain-containing protein [Ilumatobacter nonamiensis]
MNAVTSTTTASTATTTTPRASRLARRTGLAYLGIIATGIFAEFAVRGSLIVDDDPVATAENIAASPRLFGVGIGADVVMIALDVVVAIGLLGLLRHVSRRIAATATVLRLIQGAVIAVNLINLTRALGFASDAVDANGTVLAGPAQDALDAVERHALGYDTGLIAFGLSCLVVAWLLAAGRLVPRLLAYGLAATGVIYLTGSFAALFAPSASSVIEPFYAICLVVELAFAIRLVTRGLDVPTHAPTRRPVTVAA